MKSQLESVAFAVPMPCLAEVAHAVLQCCKGGDSTVLSAGRPYLVGQIILALAAQLMRLDAGCRCARAASVTRSGVLVLHSHPDSPKMHCVQLQMTRTQATMYSPMVPGPRS